MDQKVAIIVLNWNGLSDTLECLRSLSEQSYTYYQIILVDNGSTEKGTSDFLKQVGSMYKERLVIIKSDKNTGFAGGVNIGIEYALKNTFDFVALFNNDASADKDWLRELVRAANTYGSGITTGLLLHQDGHTIDTSGDSLSIWGLPFPRSRDDPAIRAPRSGEVFSGCGGASLYDMGMLRQIGLFDDKFFAYYEDTDISFRALIYGWSVFYTDKAIAYHKRGATSDKIPGFTTYQTFKNLPIFFIKNTPSKLLLRIGVRFWFAYYAIFANAIFQGRGLPAIKGFAMSIYLSLRFAYPQRYNIQKHLTAQSYEKIKKLIHYDLPPDQTGLRQLRSYVHRTKE